MAEFTNLTLKIDQQVLLYARWRALREGTSVNAVVEAFLAEYAGRIPEGVPKRRRAPRATAQRGGSKSGGRTG